MSDRTQDRRRWFSNYSETRNIFTLTSSPQWADKLDALNNDHKSYMGLYDGGEGCRKGSARVDSYDRGEGPHQLQQKASHLGNHQCGGDGSNCALSPQHIEIGSSELFSRLLSFRYTACMDDNTKFDCIGPRQQIHLRGPFLQDLPIQLSSLFTLALPMPCYTSPLARR